MRVFLILLLNSFLYTNAPAQDIVEVKLIQVLEKSEIQAEFSYTPFGSIKEEKLRNSYHVYSYNEKNQLISVGGYMNHAFTSAYATKEKTYWTPPLNTPKEFTTIFEYNENGQLKRSIYNLGYAVYIHGKKDRIVKIQYFFKSKLTKVREFKYDKRGNIVREQTYGLSDSGRRNFQDRTEYEFDRKPNPYLGFHKIIEPGKYTNPNNIIKTIKGKNVYGATTYEYNDKGYPIKDNNGVEYLYSSR
jgi:hypothetical protein